MRCSFPVLRSREDAGLSCERFCRLSTPHVWTAAQQLHPHRASTFPAICKPSKMSWLITCCTGQNVVIFATRKQAENVAQELANVREDITKGATTSEAVENHYVSQSVTSLFSVSQCWNSTLTTKSRNVSQQVAAEANTAFFSNGSSVGLSTSRAGILKKMSTW